MIQAVRSGIQLVGNANAHLSHPRRERVVSDFNKSLLPIVGDDSNFKDAAPLLFGMEFAKKGKEMVDQVKVMWSSYPKNLERKSPFFRGGTLATRFSRKYGRGGAQSFRYNRERPYQGGKGQFHTQKRTQN